MNKNNLLTNVKYFTSRNINEEKEEYYYTQVIAGELSQITYRGKVTIFENDSKINWSFCDEDTKYQYKELSLTPFWFQNIIVDLCEIYKEQYDKNIRAENSVSSTFNRSGQEILDKIELLRKRRQSYDGYLNSKYESSLIEIIDTLNILQEIMSSTNINWEDDSKNCYFSRLINVNCINDISSDIIKFQWTKEQIKSLEKAKVIIKKLYDIKNKIVSIHIKTKYLSFIQECKWYLSILMKEMNNLQINWRETMSLSMLFGIINGWDDNSMYHLQYKDDYNKSCLSIVKGYYRYYQRFLTINE